MSKKFLINIFFDFSFLIIIYPLQNEGKNNIKTAKSSNLPSNIPNDNIHLEISGIDLKFPLGPIISPSPGPTFDIEEAAPEIAVKKSRPVIDSNIAIITNINK